MQKEVLVYISGAITAKNGNSIEENVATGLKTFLSLTSMGIPSFCPQLIAAFPSAHEIQYTTWMAYDLAVLDHCTHMLMLPKWEESSGAVKEKKYAEVLRMPVLLSIHDLVELLDAKE